MCSFCFRPLNIESQQSKSPLSDCIGRGLQRIPAGSSPPAAGKSAEVKLGEEDLPPGFLFEGRYLEALALVRKAVLCVF